jgi:predicted RNA binding protein YcfA (HicA-like mRNA interferase family)
VSKLPRPTAKDLIAELEKADFTVIRIKGSHHFLRHTDGRKTVVPVHAGETIGPGLLAKILKVCDVTASQLAGLL